MSRILWNPKVHDHLNISQLSVPICSHKIQRYILILSCNHPGLPAVSFEVSPRKPPVHISLLHTSHMHRRSHTLCSDYPTNIWLRAGTTRLHIMPVSLPRCYSKPSQPAKPSQAKVLTGGRRLARSAQVDVPLPVNHSRV